MASLTVKEQYYSLATVHLHWQLQSWTVSQPHKMEMLLCRIFASTFRRCWWNINLQLEMLASLSCL